MHSSGDSCAQILSAGAARVDITPQSSVFLFGYPHVDRYSNGVYDRLESAALFLKMGNEAALFIANDLIFVDKEMVAEARGRISAQTGVPSEAIAITANHTHSGPVVVDYVSNSADPVVPKADSGYREWVVTCMVRAACEAVRTAVPAEAGLKVTRVSGIGSNRHDPVGPSDPEVPVLVVRSLRDRAILGCMVVYGMHPTVLHEDSTLISADFPGLARQYLRDQRILPANCPIIYHMGVSGNQSPRYVVRENTFAEAKRLGEKLGAFIGTAVASIEYTQQLPIDSRVTSVALGEREFPSVAQALMDAERAKSRLNKLREDGAPRANVRTAECDWFGAEETVELSRAAADGRLRTAAAKCSPAEIQLIMIGPWKFVLWPGEFFVEYALEVKRHVPDAYIITCANGELQGYIVTPEAAAGGYYEAANAIFCPENGSRVVESTLKLISGTERNR